jgi:plasmid stabilization system protein ParE
MHRLKYLPVARIDLRNIVSYIADILKAPQAALDFVDTLDHAITRLQQFPYSCKVYQPVEPLEVEYRALPVNNYLVFYRVSAQEIEIHRIVYAKMDLNSILL